MAEFGFHTPLESTRFSGPGTPDQIQQVWFLKWVPFALFHGHNPFFTQNQNYPVGLNVLANNSMFALGALFSPVTSLFGAVVTWNILIRLAVVLSATSMCLVLRRWTTWWPAAFAGGLLYGFSSYATFYGSGYLFLVFVPIPPLIFLLLFEILVRQRWRATWTGGLLGTLCGVQYLISAEVLASTLVMGVLACGLYLLANRESLGAEGAYVKTALIYGAVIGAALFAFPVVFTLFGTAHIHGVPELAGEPGDLLGAFVPGKYQLVDPAVTKDVWSAFSPYFYSASLYLGVPLIVALTSIVVWLRRSGPVLFAGAMAVIAFVLSLGSPLYVDHKDTHFPLPFILLAHLPIIEGIVATRFSLFTNLFGSAIVAIGLEQLFRRLRRSDHLLWSSRKWIDGVAGGTVAVFAGIVAVSLLPSHVQSSSSTYVASYITSGAGTAIPRGSVVLAYPYPNTPVHVLNGKSVIFAPFVESLDDVLLGQALSGFRFDLVGGYGWAPSRGIDTLPNPSPLYPSSVEVLFNVAFYGSETPAQRALLGKSHLIADLRLFMRSHHIDSIIVLPLGRHPATVVRYVDAAIGPPSASKQGTVWLDVKQRLATASLHPH